MSENDLSRVSPRPEIDLSRATIQDKEQYSLFFYQAKNFFETGNLTKLVDLATQTIDIMNRCNPIGAAYDNSRSLGVIFNEKYQWLMDNISEVKKIVSCAINYKRKYYKEHWFGKITRFVLLCLGMWNNGYTSAIMKAEDFLLFWDSRIPLYETKCGGTYRERCMFPLRSAKRLREQLNIEDFYNYTPLRQIKIAGYCDFTNLPPVFVKV
jgi:hypothetical protein